jgi:type IV pilus assembly protein PilB
MFEGSTFYEPKGCPKCNGLGYKGRGAVMEIMLVTDELRQLILQNVDASAIRDAAQQSGMTTLRDAGLERVKEGLTTVEEAMRVTGGE